MGERRRGRARRVSGCGEFHAEVAAADGVGLAALPSRGGEQGVELLKVPFHAARHGEHAHVRQDREVGLADLADHGLQDEHAPAVARGSPAVAQDGRGPLVVPVVQHRLQQVQVRGGNLFEEVARDGGEPAGQAAPGGLRTRALGCVRQVEDLAPQSRVNTDQLKDELPVRAVMHRGAWRFSRLGERGGAVTVPAGAFIIRHDEPPTLFQVDRGATARVLTMPASVLGPLIGDRQIVGHADSAEARLVTAHASMLAETVHDLTLAGVRSARDALLELAKGVLRREFDDTEPRLAPALARAAMQIADDRLADPDLSPTVLARDLHVSVRTLHRAFTTAGESVSAYIRRSRLEQARRELAAPLVRPDVSEIAARWQFADSSHFIRAFKPLEQRRRAIGVSRSLRVNPSDRAVAS